MLQKSSSNIKWETVQCEGKWFTYLKLNRWKCTAFADKNCTISVYM